MGNTSPTLNTHVGCVLGSSRNQVPHHRTTCSLISELRILIQALGRISIAGDCPGLLGYYALTTRSNWKRPDQEREHVESVPRLEEPQQLIKDERAASQPTVYSCKCDTLCLCIFNSDVISVIAMCYFMHSCLHDNVRTTYACSAEVPYSVLMCNHLQLFVLCYLICHWQFKVWLKEMHCEQTSLLSCLLYTSSWASMAHCSLIC